MSKLIPEIREELIKIIKGVEKSWHPEKAYFKTVEHEGKIIAYPNELLSSYNKSIFLLRQKAINFGKGLSDTEII